MSEKQALQLVCASCGAVNRVPASRLADRPVCGKCKSLILSGEAINVGDANFARWLQKNDLPVVVDFWAPWCGPCVSFAPVYKDVAKRWAGRARFLKLDTEAQSVTAGQYQIRSIPTLMVFSQGREVARNAGALPPAQFEQWLANYLPRH